MNLKYYYFNFYKFQTLIYFIFLFNKLKKNVIEFIKAKSKTKNSN